ncbi:DMSO reductase [Mesorhizobium sp. NBSH29]|uniref:dimethyl sulfoxide reductase anchor subunit family protein n=1 Tax=Mesorhizobium sp. NBSH29 TaxID=2654249 RepID=UPI00189640E3|nr:DmsC/YnfH family molybdoenzyme membrane anchor subunit [Mesorhizobium sp. NBSH29]QPC88058.1 DMSO reductase [Mesorhizobium sp. NBSH29]
MHPALSIIAFTTLSGLGYGLAAVLGLGLLDPQALATKAAHLLALAMIGGGLLSSTLHLGNPQRAWRAFSQWRSSWLSREGVMAVITFVPLLLAAWASVIEGRYLAPAGLLGAVLTGVTVYCTAMIYASLKSIDAWHTKLTPVCYLLFAASGGFLLASFFAILGEGAVGVLLSGALVFTMAAWIAKICWRRRMETLVPTSTPESATGLGHIGTVRLFERPHMTDNYLTREMGFRVARKHAMKLRRISLLLGGLVPGAVVFILLIIALAGATAHVWGMVAMGLAVLSHVIGILTERWLFFAEARHAVMNYYGG